MSNLWCTFDEMARVLVIDDDRAIGRLIERVLAPEHQVVVLTHGEEAIKQIAAGERFDLVICDVNMPGLTGMEVHAAVRKLDPEQARRIVFMTAAQRRDLPNRCLVKPVPLATIRELASSFLPIRLRGPK